MAVAAKKNRAQRNWLEPWTPPEPVAPPPPGPTQRFTTRIVLRTLGGTLAVFDSERQDNTKSHRRVHTECAYYGLAIPPRTAEALVKYKAREARQAAKLRAAAGGAPIANDERQTSYPPAMKPPVIEHPHPVLHSIESATWSDPPPEKIGDTETEWLNPPPELPPRKGHGSKAKTRVLDALARMQRDEVWLWELQIELGARTRSDRNSIDRTVQHLVADGDVERWNALDIGTGRKKPKVRSARIRE